MTLLQFDYLMAKLSFAIVNKLSFFYDFLLSKKRWIHESPTIISDLKHFMSLKFWRKQKSSQLSSMEVNFMIFVKFIACKKMVPLKLGSQYLRKLIWTLPSSKKFLDRQ